MENVGARVQAIRIDREMTSTELAEKVGVSQAQISRLENGLQGWRSATLQKAAKALGVTVGFLYSDQDSLAAMASMVKRHPDLKKVLQSVVHVDLALQLAKLKSAKPKAFRAVKAVIEQLTK